MSFLKRVKDGFGKVFMGKDFVPRELLELNEYFRHYGPIKFHFERLGDGSTLARSVNFKFGSIITSGRDSLELDKNIRDAILTSFEIPSSYEKEAGIYSIGNAKEQSNTLHSYALT